MRFYHILLILLVAVIALFVFLSKKYYNPFKLIFIFGKKGSGKSCYLVHEMLKHLKHGWTVYTDLNVSIPGIRYINPQDLAEFDPDPYSLICLDEVGLTWNNRNWKSFNDGLTEFIKLQRHKRIKLIINSQSFDVDKKIRDCTDSMILQSNIGNFISVGRPIVRKVTLTDPNFTNESKIVDALTFLPIVSLFPLRFNLHLYYMPKYFQYFNSFACDPRPPMPYTLAPVPPDHLTYTYLRRQGFSKSVCQKIIKLYS